MKKNKSLLKKVICILILFFIGLVLVMYDWEGLRKEKIYIVFEKNVKSGECPRPIVSNSTYQFCTLTNDTITLLPEPFKEISLEKIKGYTILPLDSLQELLTNNYSDSKISFYIIEKDTKNNSTKIAKAYINRIITDTF